MSVAVTIPMHGAAATIRRAVDSVLAQTHRDLDLYVLNDGDGPEAWAPLADIADQRLHRIDLPENRGRYAADHYAVTELVDAEWWVPHDADDWCEPDWIERLIDAADDADVVLAPQTVHPLRGDVKVEEVQRWDGSARFRWHAHMAGLWSVSWLRDVGLTNPHVRVGWDTVMTSAAFVTGRVNVAETAGYHRVRRRDSLTNAPDTGMGSSLRKATAKVLRSVWSQIVADPTATRRIVASAPWPSMAPPAPTTTPAGAVDLTSDQKLWGSWAMHPGAAAEIDARLHQLAPRVVVESGSGSSTLVLARYAEATGATVVSLEHDRQFYDRTLRLLRRHRLAGKVDVRLAPLVDTADGPWYDTDLPDGIEFALIDGPPERCGGRAAALPELHRHLADGWELWLDDGGREGERAALAAWEGRYGVAVQRTRIPHSLVRVTPSVVAPPPVDASEVTVTLLTGGRPQTLAASLASMPPSLLASAQVIALHNGSDPETGEVLAGYSDVIDKLIETPTMVSIGDAASLLASHVGDRPYWLHLEDDWQHTTSVGGWLQVAQAALGDPSVAQVRLRHRADKVLDRHMVTRKPLRWKQHPQGLIADAHLSTNPTLVRSEDAVKMWPAAGERAMQRRALDAGMARVVQLHPGVFAHADDGVSLRMATGCEA